jgi:hypothetical protein
MRGASDGAIGEDVEGSALDVRGWMFAKERTRRRQKAKRTSPEAVEQKEAREREGLAKAEVQWSVTSNHFPKRQRQMVNPVDLIVVIEMHYHFLRHIEEGWLRITSNIRLKRK